MSANIFGRLRRLFPAQPLLICKVLEIHPDDTSTVLLPSALAVSYGAGLLAGATLRVRGSSVPVDGQAFVRNGVIESAAPGGDVAELVLGTVVDNPLGPALLVAQPTLALSAAQVGAPYAASVATGFTGGYAPLTFSLAGGALPPGVALTAGSGALVGPVTAAGAYAFSVSCADSTRRQALLAVTLTAA
jgi:Putative Ig domain